MASGRVWFITGCSTGFGRALAEKVDAPNPPLRLESMQSSGELESGPPRFRTRCPTPARQ